MACHLDRKETELFALLTELLVDNEIEQNVLRVKVGSQGAEFGRAYLRLFDLGLVSERLVRPNLLRRLFGGHEEVFIGLTDEGRQVAVKMFVDAEVVAVESETVDQTVLEQEVQHQQDKLNGQGDAPAVPIHDASFDTANCRSAVAQSTSRLRLKDYTETLGGAPVELGITYPASNRLDGLAELVGLLGFDLTRAGRLLAANRWAEGQPDVQVALEIVVASLAHAARLKLTKTTDLDIDAVVHLIEAVRAMFRPFVMENMLGEQILTEALTMMRGFVVGAVGLSELDQYLSDPLRGLAPPSTCPEHIFLLINVEED
jgi:hypothetical protein